MNKEIFDTHNIVPILFEWANENFFVYRLWIYGSYVKGNFRRDSDVDVAIDVFGNHESPYQRFWFDHDIWREDLQKYLPLKVHLCHYDPSTPGDLPVKFAVLYASKNLAQSV